MRTKIGICGSIDGLPEFCTPADLSLILPVSRATSTAWQSKSGFPRSELDGASSSRGSPSKNGSSRNAGWRESFDGSDLAWQDGPKGRGVSIKRRTRAGCFNIE